MKTQSFIVNRIYYFFFASPYTLLQGREHSWNITNKTTPVYFDLDKLLQSREKDSVLKQRKVSEIISQNEVSEDSLLDRPRGIEGACNTWTATQLSRTAPANFRKPVYKGFILALEHLIYKAINN